MRKILLHQGVQPRIEAIRPTCMHEASIISAVAVALMGLFVSSLKTIPLKEHLVRPLQALSFFVVLVGEMAVLSMYRWAREFFGLPLIPAWYPWRGEWLFGLLALDVFVAWVWVCVGIALMHEPDGLTQADLLDRRFRYSLAFVVFALTVSFAYFLLWVWLG